MKRFNGVTLTPRKSLSDELITVCEAVSAKRARTVIDHIFKHGIITNEELSEQYGYDHPPRAIRDVRENGIPLITHKVSSPKTGRSVGAYTFGSVSDIKRGRIGGRKAFSKQFKKALIERYGACDAFSGERLDERYLQIDHRIPYEVGGDNSVLDAAEFMLLDASSQRAKSWSCEHCENFTDLHDTRICQTCFWAWPEAYEHVALIQSRRLQLVWRGDEVEQYKMLKADADRMRISLADLIKTRLREK